MNNTEKENQTALSVKAKKATLRHNSAGGYDGYELKWADEFDGDSLNRDDWNVELHEPGWVNEELQEYVDSERNLHLEDGKLVITPIQTRHEDGTYSYTSGRITTQNKHDYTYGLFEARLKVPAGKGYLPAFWLMPTDENLYGQWPRCGEIDIMEVLGHATDTEHGTIHFGNPHDQRQGTYKLTEGTFADDYHTFAVEWLPGGLIWYVDGEEFYRTGDWHSTTQGQGTITYPAPFDQPFHVLLNLAVGGSWVGYPDDETFKAQDYCVDYVRIYQKTGGYDDSHVQKPEKDAGTEGADTKTEKDAKMENADTKTKTVLADGNYVYNGSFREGERRLGFWEITNHAGAEVSVTNASASDRRCKVVIPEAASGNSAPNNTAPKNTTPNNTAPNNTAPQNTGSECAVVIAQSGLALGDGKFVFSFEIEGPAGRKVTVNIAGQEKEVDLDGSRQEITGKLALEETESKNRDIVFTMTSAGTYYLNHVRIVDDRLIKNGNFNAGFAGYEVFVDSGAKASYVVDGLEEDNAASFTVTNTSDKDWKIQLKQNNVELEQGQWYRLKLDVKSTIDRKFKYAIGRDESKKKKGEDNENENGTPYVCKTVDITSEWQIFTQDFHMTEPTDLASVLSLYMGAVDDIQITDLHTICIDHVSLEKIAQAEGTE